MSKPNQCNLGIFFVPECQAVSGAAVAGTILPICSLAIFHTVSKGQTEIWAEITHTSLVILPRAGAVTRALGSLETNQLNFPYL